VQRVDEQRQQAGADDRRLVTRPGRHPWRVAGAPTSIRAASRVNARDSARRRSSRKAASCASSASRRRPSDVLGSPSQRTVGLVEDDGVRDVVELKLPRFVPIEEAPRRRDDDRHAPPQRMRLITRTEPP
jgi:hypothetical protein